MPEYLAPGVYVEEVPSGNKPIEGVSTSTAAMIGVTQRGPVDEPTLVTSFADFTRKFGGYLDHRVFTGGLDLLPYAVEGFFVNGGSRVFVTRVLGDGASNASVDLYGTPVVNAATTALTQRAVAGATTLMIDDGTNIGSGDTLLLLNGTRSEYVTAQSNPVQTGVRLYGRLHSAHGADAVAIQDETVDEDLTARVAGDMSLGDTSLNLNSVAGLVAGEVLRIRDTVNGARTEYVTITANGAAGIDEAGLLFDHAAASTELHRVTLSDAAGEPAGGRTVDTGAALGALLIPLTNTTSLAADQILRIGGEFYVVQSVVSSLSIAATPTVSIHGADTVVIKQLPLLRVHARHAGAWGNELRIRLRAASILETTVAAAAAAGDSPVTLEAAFGLGAGSVLNVTRGTPATQILRQRVAAVDLNVNEVDFAGGVGVALQAGASPDDASSVEFDLIVERLNEDGKVVESEAFGGLGMDPSHARYAVTVVGSYDRAADEASETGQSELIRLSDLTQDDNGVDLAGAANSRLAVPYDGIARAMTDGDDDIAGIDDNTFIGVPADDPGDRTGIYTFENEDDVSIVAAPGRTSQTVQNALLNHCELMRYRFAVLDAQDNAKLKQVQTQRQRYDTTRGALYYPWLTVSDPFGRNGDVVYLPPSGHVTGVYARSDNTRGVHKAPANEVVRGINDLQIRLTKGEQDILNPKHVNCLRDFRENSRGLRVWGARTLSSDPEWKYVNVRRLFLFVEKSIERGLQFAVFEPNAEPLWATARRSITNFLTSVWRNGGALEGTKPEEAFFVNVGLNTMTQNDIDNGRLIVIVGIAPVKPAEFVIIRISQKPREASG